MNCEKGRAVFFRVTTAGNLAKEKISSPTLTMEHPGYIYVFLYNRSNSANWVYFDDLKVTHQRSPIVAGADFYPFGLPMEGREITQEDYRWGYQGQYAEKDTVTGWNQFQLRMYDARFGRWLSVDPYGQYASPYLGMGNIPHMGTDPDGGLFGLGPVISGALIGAVVGTAAGLIFDKDNWYMWTLGGAGLGALGGGIYKASTYDLTGIGRTGKNPKYANASNAKTLTIKSLNLKKPTMPVLGQGIGLVVKETPRILYSYLTYQGNSIQPNTGTLTWTDVWSDGRREVSGTWDANSGSSSSRPTPEGEDWDLSNSRDRTETAFVRDGVGFSIDITPDPRHGRSLLRIHPDGNVPGTLGCIGLTGNAGEIRNFANRVRNYLRIHGRMRLRVRGTYNPNAPELINPPQRPVNIRDRIH